MNMDNIQKTAWTKSRSHPYIFLHDSLMGSPHHFCQPLVDATSWGTNKGRAAALLFRLMTNCIFLIEVPNVKPSFIVVRPKGLQINQTEGGEKVHGME
ncbi:hypothetical protein QO009_000942 [Brevibacillus aydinogluensis]|uniref:hypothetical protein n=1 Tax=Brevibacillus aydinogluensis TaxID=927786 RepID=UPI002892AE89|nr:hypothetical protein [Brevibacillus aydinogluensis]MDT3415086.1 hypothetical protein [Brevibacillus aydinogluensis]